MCGRVRDVVCCRGEGRFNSLPITSASVRGHPVMGVPTATAAFRCHAEAIIDQGIAAARTGVNS